MTKKRITSIKRSLLGIGAVLGTAAFSVLPAYAASNTNFTQVISAGVLSTDILDSSRNSVSSPAVPMTAKTFSFSCLSGVNASTGTLGTNNERLYVSNPDGADNGWTLTLAATGGATSTWANGGATSRIDFNDPSGSTQGCSDGADADSQGGQLTINPSAGALTTDCTSCSATGISLGASSAFNQGTVDNVTLVNAGSSSNDIWRGYLTNVSVSQTIPAETASDSYNLDLTLTATAQ